eukprot:6204754-Pleurochrysis_carterae.AAC.1
MARRWRDRQGELLGNQVESDPRTELKAQMTRGGLPFERESTPQRLPERCGQRARANTHEHSVVARWTAQRNPWRMRCRLTTLCPRRPGQRRRTVALAIEGATRRRGEAIARRDCRR